MNLYMHLIDGKPAVFQPQFGTIVYTGMACKRFATSLKQIRDEHRMSAKQDQQNLPPSQWPKYGYVRLQLTQSEKP